MTSGRTLLARGEDADVFAIDDTRVLRRYRRRAVPEREVAIMRYVRERGYPAPRVIDVSGDTAAGFPRQRGRRGPASGPSSGERDALAARPSGD